MIEVIGEAESSEHNAALNLAEAFENLWPGITNTSAAKEHIKIASNVKISGYRVSDIDIVVCAKFDNSRKFVPNRVVKDKHGSTIGRQAICVENFLVAIEVKDHDESGVEIVGDNVKVRYSRGSQGRWHSATDQNVNQVHSLVAYAKDLGVDAYVHRCLIMHGLGKVRTGGVVAAGFSGVDFLSAVVSLSSVGKSARGLTLASSSGQQISQFMDASLFKAIVPTSLDRKRMDMVVTTTKESEALRESLGKKMVCLRGHGGAGKTVMCLQAAWQAFEREGLRTLVLTYNHALAADIRRMMGLLNVPSNPEDGGVTIETVMSFMYSWFRRLQLIEGDDDQDFENYDRHCASTVELLEAGAITQQDIERVVSDNPDLYDYDCVLVDEAQDWPQGEVELLKALYGAKRICIADGIDQILRGSRPTWARGLSGDERSLITLDKCLRMKRNLAVFSNSLGDLSGVKWEAKPNDKAGGGKVIISLSPYDQAPGLHDQLLVEAKEKGNAELDFLHCVPSSEVIKTDRKRSQLGSWLTSGGNKVWDGVDDQTRKDFPRSKEQFRIVQYASCRGLEGWTVVLHHLDLYWEECHQVKMIEGLSEAEALAFENIEEMAPKEAWRKVMISLTRPIDTLVITLSNTSSPCSKALLSVAKDLAGFVEIRD